MNREAAVISLTMTMPACEIHKFANLNKYKIQQKQLPAESPHQIHTKTAASKACYFLVVGHNMTVTIAWCAAE